MCLLTLQIYADNYIPIVYALMVFLSEFLPLFAGILLNCHSTHSRFPNLKIIVGHLGERIPSDLNRIDNRVFLFFSSDVS